MNKPENCIIVIFGGTGDLTKRKLLPALFDLYSRKLLPSKFAVISTGRSECSNEQYRNNMFEALNQFYNKQKADVGQFKIFLKNIHYQQGNSRNQEDYLILKKRITGLNDVINSNGNYIFYLATSPALFSVISENIGSVGLNKEGDGWKRLVVEKPFGYNLDSAKSLNQTLLNIFDEKQIYRIDHYLGKETVQNILAFRFANGIFEPLWNRNYIHHIECTGAENIGVEPEVNIMIHLVF